jgi:hypothetical protein
LHCDSKDLDFKLSEMAEKEGFSITDIDFLKSKWYTTAEVERKFTIYNFYLQKLALILIASIYFCWLAISIHFFNYKMSDVHMDSGLWSSSL